MRKFMATCCLTLALVGCGPSEPPTPQVSAPSVPVTTDPSRPIVCIINAPLSDPINVTVVSPTTEPSTTIFTVKIPPSETVHKFCLTVYVTGVANGGQASAPVEMILQRTPVGTQLERITSRSFYGANALQNAGVGGQTQQDGSFEFRSMSNGIIEPTMWTARGWRQRIM